MTRNNWIILCLSYIVGLLSTNLIPISSSGLTRQQLSVLIVGTICLSVIVVLISNIIEQGTPLPKISLALRRLKAAYKQCLYAAIVATLAIVYLQLRIPQPNSNDLSYQVTASASQFATVSGKVLTEPRLNDSQRLKFVLAAEKVNKKDSVSGKLYATVPLLQGTGIHPGMNLNLKGILYLPQAAKTASGFDFKTYLARQGIFAGMQGFEATLDLDSEPRWGWWKLRQRIVRSQLQGLGSPVGQLVSSMVLGRKAVDLPGDIRDRFIEAGLAHVLAASGFHVSLLLGIILKLTNRFAAKPRLIIGIGTLLVYLGLTGVQASVFRACLMGVAVLIALAMETKVKPLGSLLLAATIILLFNPLFIGDLGFQLSFLATFGLIVSLPGLQARLDWLPPTMATLVAVPLAASIWVLPLLSYEFNSVATYSIIVNIISTPLIMLISLGGMISAIAALIIPMVGSTIAWLLFYPTLLLIAIINFFTNLPGSSWAIRQISLGALLTIYSLFLLVWLNQWWRDRIRLICLFILTLIIIPTIYQHFNLTQITVLAIQPEPVIVIQDRGTVALINSGESKTVKYNVIPFLTNQGINHLDYGIDLSQTVDADWSQISDRLPIHNFISHPNRETSFTPTNKNTLTQNLDRAIKLTSSLRIVTQSFNLSFNSQLSLLRLKTATNNWLILNNTQRDPYLVQQYIRQSKLSDQSPILVGKKITSTWLEIQPQIIIASDKPKTIKRRNHNNIQFYNPKQQGAINWTPKSGVKPLIDSPEW